MSSEIVQTETYPSGAAVFDVENQDSSLEKHAHQLAESHSVKQAEGEKPFLTDHFDAYEDLIRRVVQYFKKASQNELATTYSAEWILDNYYIVQQALRQMREDLPGKYYRELPKLDSGELAGFPRVYAIAKDIVVQQRALLDVDNITDFLHLYQKVRPIKMGELWALPIMLRLCIVQSLISALVEITKLPLEIYHPNALMDLSGFISNEEIVANTIISLRGLSVEDWKTFFEEISLVENILRQDPAGIYGRMDFDTRDSYRKVVEKIAVTSSKDEKEVARIAIDLTKKGAETNLQSRDAHVGFFLVDRGRQRLEEVVGYTPETSDRLNRWILARPGFIYLASIGAIASLIILFALVYASNFEAGFITLMVIAFLSFVPALTIAVDLTNWLITRTLKPRVLPKLDFSEGVPGDFCTMVVIPTLFSDKEDIDPLLQQIELHYLRNSDQNLYFALVTDFADASEQKMAGDDELLEIMEAGINGLNIRHQRNQHSPFFLFHRERIWNPKEGVWMGWERKRGKLHELNRLILGEENTTFIKKVGVLDVLNSIQYIITLDMDTVLPGKSAQRLIAAIAHPLNKAEFDEETGKVVNGYTILQPRTTINPTTANQSIFTRVFSGDTGLDLYTLAVSDVYQDLFGEGIYVGKGIYDVSAFERSLKDIVPENALLSHDLFEGIHGRAGLVSDIVLIEDYPENYAVYIRRLHRWIRGDWQLFPWLFRRVPASPLKYEDMDYQTSKPRKLLNRLTLIDRWQILDNLRRSLLTPVLMLLFVFGWTWFPGSPIIWTLFGLFALSIPFITEFISSLIGFFKGSTDQKKYGRSYRPVGNNAFRWLLALVFLPYEALLAADAIITTFVRVYITRRDLLKWMTAAHTTRILSGLVDQRGIIRQMAYALMLSLLLFILIILVRPDILPIVFPLLVMWLVSPEAAYWISRPIVYKPRPTTDNERQELRKLAFQTWLFFEQLIGPEDHWLPPDHFQESPRGVIAHRTSPTNIGMGLTSIVAAYDLGYLGMLDLVSRLRITFETYSKLEKYRGHLLNWYDTRSLEPLPPHYVSTVDSGNLAVSLIAVAQSCQDILDEPMLRREAWQGLLDSILLLMDPVEKIKLDEAIQPRQYLEEQLDLIKGLVREVSENVDDWTHAYIQSVSTELWEELDRRMITLLEAISHSLPPDSLQRLRIYAHAARSRREALRREIDMLLPWLSHLAKLPVIFKLEEETSSFGEEIRRFLDLFNPAPSLNSIDEVSKRAKIHLETIEEHLKERDGRPQVKETLEWIASIKVSLEEAAMKAKVLKIGYREIQQQCDAMVKEMDFSFLFNRQRQVFHIGYNVSLGKHDDNYYDLLASEARIASLIAIAKDDVPQKHWLHLSRPLVEVDSTQALLSWSATMFEYLMPVLYFKHYDGTLLHHSAQAAVDHQITYGKKKKTPWGISESGYYRFDDNQNYQYRAFGVPGLGYKRGLSDDLVITPYASLLALPFKPQEVLKNIDDLIQLGMLGKYGFYEAVDFTHHRLPLGEEYKIVRSYMSHHQGMILLSIANYLNDQLIVNRVHSNLNIRSFELLLQEKIPHGAPLEDLQAEEGREVQPAVQQIATNPWEVNPYPPQPHVHYLSNGQYSVLITSSGGGYSVWKDSDLTRWRVDATLDNWGQWFYVQDLDRDISWSSAYQPLKKAGQSQHVFFNAYMVQFQRRDHDISVDTEITISPEDDLEIRRIRLTNHTELPRRLRVTSYAEVVMAPQAADERHPAFNKLFIESEMVPDKNALIFNRRRRSHLEDRIYLAHALVVEPGQKASPIHHTDRNRFIGRGRTVENPQYLEKNSGQPLELTQPSIDPIMSLEQEVLLNPHSSVEIAFLTAAAGSRKDVLKIIDRFISLHMINRAFDQARTKAEVELVRYGLNTHQLGFIQRLLSVLIYPHASMRADHKKLVSNTKGQPSYWAYGISGDHPILLMKVHGQEDLALVQEVLQAHAYWRSRNLKIDLVILNEQGTDYGQELNQQLHRLMHIMKSDAWLNRHGGIFLLLVDRLHEGDKDLFEAGARAVLDGNDGRLENQLEKMNLQPIVLPPFSPEYEVGEREETPKLQRPENLLFDNGFGGFSKDGKEYVIFLDEGQWTPAPWVNVIANPKFGFLVSETGSGNTWSENSGENRLTPWNNDPVQEQPGEGIYLRDEETAQVWSPTPLPARGEGPYIIRHGAGYSIFEHNSQGLRQKLRLYAVPDTTVKIASLHLENTWKRTRRITVTYYAEWVLGVNRSLSQSYLISEYDDENQALLATNPYNTEFAGRVAFLASTRPLHGVSSDREEFLGRMGSRAKPEALSRIGLSGRVYAGSDPCGVVQVHVDLAPGEEQEVVFILGQALNREEAQALVSRYKAHEAVSQAWQDVHQYWDDLLMTVQVKTPDLAMDILLNRWMLYQTLSCRIWGRTAFYQSSGAYGFRDQLQDVACLIHIAPEMIREHILLSASKQFDTGDVLHWWHPPSGRGVRTRYSDDLLWLPYITSYYINSVGDEGILEEEAPFLSGEPLEKNEKERYGIYEPTKGSFPIYEHCRRAIEKGSTTGPHGLPLIGGGDWNDGMNRVGINGKGESVWLGWFLYDTLKKFAVINEQVDKAAQAEAYRHMADDYLRSIEENAWDGSWYLRAYFDDGFPIGSSRNRECKIDAIAQSWSVISEGGERDRAYGAMKLVVDELVLEDDRLLLLFKPPFDRTPRDPGYIKGYIPGIRENGGQYTHAAIWTAWAFTALGDGDYAGKLFRLLNPILHGDTPEKILRYRVEPYVIAADIYSQPPFTRHGGWTWYTGSSGWMYRLGLEAILGLRKVRGSLVVDPCIPRDWPGFTITYRFGDTGYEIEVENKEKVNRGVIEVRMDGEILPDGKIPLVNDGNNKKVTVRMGEKNG
jgi:cyclic beta-1,2-glucan synthetase